MISLALDYLQPGAKGATITMSNYESAGLSFIPGEDSLFFLLNGLVDECLHRESKRGNWNVMYCPNLTCTGIKINTYESTIQTSHSGFKTTFKTQ